MRGSSGDAVSVLQEELNTYKSLKNEAEIAYYLGIINISEMTSVQSLTDEEANKIRYAADHPYLSFKNNAVSVILDLIDGYSAEASRGDDSASGIAKIYDKDNYRLITGAVIYKNLSAEKGFTGGNSRTVYNSKIKGNEVRVDVELPTGDSTGNIHVHINQEKIFINTEEDIANLPKALRKDESLLNSIRKVIRFVGKLRERLHEENY